MVMLADWMMDIYDLSGMNLMLMDSLNSENLDRMVDQWTLRMVMNLMIGLMMG